MYVWHDAQDQLAVSNAAAAAYTYTSGVHGSYRSPSATNPASFNAVRISYGDCLARATRMSGRGHCRRSSASTRWARPLLKGCIRTNRRTAHPFLPL